MVKVSKWLAYLLGIFMIAMGAMKFFGNVPVFQLVDNNLASKYGLELGFINPALKYLTGVLEIIAGALLLLGNRESGALLSITIIAGAIATHLFVIGISVPMSLAPDAPKSPMLFVMAAIFLIISTIVYWPSRKSDNIQTSAKVARV